MPSLRVDFFRPFRSALTLVFFIQRRHVEVFQLFLASYCGFAGFQGEAKSQIPSMHSHRTFSAPSHRPGPGLGPSPGWGPVRVGAHMGP